jgi:hypothetical protein
MYVERSLMPRSSQEGLKIARLMMVLSSLSPLFILWAIRGLPMLSDKLSIGLCLLLISAPTLVLYGRISVARKQSNTKILKIGIAEDHRDHLLVYLFALLLPLWAANLSSSRELAATLTAFAFIVFLFWHLNMHYMNIFFALFGYRVFTVTSPEDENLISGREQFVLITQRYCLRSGCEIKALRLSGTVYFEPKGWN